MTITNKILVFTDLDGSFLDHHTYSYDAALPAVKRLQDRGATIIPVTSKTMAEIDQMNLPFGQVPQIAENGMVTKLEDGSLCVNQDYDSIIRFVEQLPEELSRHMTGFNDMSVAEIMKHTSLEEDRAALAKERQGSEPFLWSGDEENMQCLLKCARDQGFSITRGGRFYHLMGQGGKAQAIQRFLCDDITSIALGDGPNDAEMLACVDYGVQIASASGTDFIVKNPKGKIIQTTQGGPVGWNAAINEILD